MVTEHHPDTPRHPGGLPRYGIYAAPAPDSPWWAFGCRWLGRDPVSGEALPPVAAGGLSVETQQAVTATPRHYGFHGTLVPPFALRDGRTLPELREVVAATARGRAAIAVRRLRLKTLGSFLALQPEPEERRINALAADCLLTLDRFRAAEPPAQRAGRDRPTLSALERRMLQEWGYPYVLDTYRFHMTLSQALSDGERERVAAALRPQLAPLAEVPWHLDAVCLVGQPNRSAPFRFLARYGFDGRSMHYCDVP